MDEGVSSSRGTARDRAAQAIHYYNNNVLKARTGSRSSAYSYQQHQRIRGGAAAAAINSRTDNLYRSNSSLELLHDCNLNECHRNHAENVVTPTLKREYGSHGSIDVIAVVDQKDDRDLAREQFFSMLQDYKPAVSTQHLCTNRFRKRIFDYVPISTLLWVRTSSIEEILILVVLSTHKEYCRFMDADA